MQQRLHKKIKNTWMLAILGTPALGLLCSVILTAISRATGIRSEGLDSFKDIISGISGIELLLLIVIIGVVVPIIEELVFRGLLWKIFSLFKAPDILTYVLTSLLFAVAHYEPLHILGVLPLSFFIGWLRLRSKSVFPGIAAHMSNNLVACAILLL